ncbi:YciI family protein [Streptomyces sp. NBC_01217]|uniref:YciI family protein n=1 Tax=Streptomyces sp. NBC_01217 TaxID=2903779 RepID=UPI002E136642|nr:YciI family protein [Streptomyces sp. NBC_01217]
MRHYLLSVVTPSGGEPPSPEALERIMRNVEGFHQELQRARAWVFAGGLSSPATATVVRAEDGDTLLTDGPYIEGKEYLGGLCIIKAPDQDAALDWGRKAARAITLPIEVRPFEGEVEG